MQVRCIVFSFECVLMCFCVCKHFTAAEGMCKCVAVCVCAFLFMFVVSVQAAFSNLLTCLSTHTTHTCTHKLPLIPILRHRWVHAMSSYDKVAKVVAPKKAQLAEAEGKYQEVRVVCACLCAKRGSVLLVHRLEVTVRSENTVKWILRLLDAQGQELTICYCLSQVMVGLRQKQDELQQIMDKLGGMEVREMNITIKIRSESVKSLVGAGTQTHTHAHTAHCTHTQTLLLPSLPVLQSNLKMDTEKKERLSCHTHCTLQHMFLRPIFPAVQPENEHREEGAPGGRGGAVLCETAAC